MIPEDEAMESTNDFVENEGKMALEDYIHQVQGRSFETATNDIFAELARKESDLILAAELGKALLERNEELSLQNERIAEDFSRKLELLEQEKYGIRRRLDAVESELESRVNELQGDLQETKLQNAEKIESLKRLERQKQSLIVELTEQNQRLTNQLKEASKNEENLCQQLQTLRDQFNARRSNFQDHVSHLEMLREEINMITEKKQDLERRMQNMLSEREGLSSTLDETTDRIMDLENKNREQENQLIASRRELNELRIANSNLMDQLETLNRHSSPTFSNSHHNVSTILPQQSISAEMDISNSSGHGSGIDSRPGSQPFGDFGDEIECDADDQLDFEEYIKLKHEALDTCLRIRALCETLRVPRERKASAGFSSFGSSSTSNDLSSNFKVGDLMETYDELELLIHDSCAFNRRFSTPNSESCDKCGFDRKDILNLQSELHTNQETNDKLHRQVAEKLEESKRKDEQISELSHKLDLKEIELEAVKEERDTARRDVRDTHLAKDELIKRAWEVRDQAVQRKNAAEIDHAKTRIELLQANSQLLDVVQQKVELSQQLEQWQVDMQELIHEQMRKKLMKQEQAKKMSNLNGLLGVNRKNSRFLGLFKFKSSNEEPS
ncbi:bicaudal D-related protein homolog isoform X1 [Artemia franciscana]|uniref:Uncharacterized protein n=1 Tax=Artemia franciscana TaxID=6661 RepID=A0AA88IG81_ARTSF|nr:hypothetical protein QYM36_000587 [Artemia franciscana]